MGSSANAKKCWCLVWEKYPGVRQKLRLESSASTKNNVFARLTKPRIVEPRHQRNISNYCLARNPFGCTGALRSCHVVLSGCPSAWLKTRHLGEFPIRLLETPTWAQDNMFPRQKEILEIHEISQLLHPAAFRAPSHSSSHRRRGLDHLAVWERCELDRTESWPLSLEPSSYSARLLSLPSGRRKSARSHLLRCCRLANLNHMLLSWMPFRCYRCLPLMTIKEGLPDRAGTLRLKVPCQGYVCCM